MSDIVERLLDWSEHDEGKINDTRDEAAAEIARLRNELHIVEVWSARIIAGTQQDNIEIARLRAEVEQNAIDLEEYRRDVERLRAALSPFASTKADDGYDYISSWPDTVIVRCEASVREIKAARAALLGDKQ